MKNEQPAYNINANHWSITPLDKDKTRFEIKHYQTKNGEGLPKSENLLCITEEECTPAMFVRNLNSHRLYAVFYTGVHIYRHQCTAYDSALVTPSEPFQEDGYGKLYDSIYLRLQHFGGDLLKNYKDDDEKGKQEYLAYCEQFKSDSAKKDFLIKVVYKMLSFELVRPRIKKLVDDYLKKNPQYKYVRIFSDEPIEKPSPSKIIGG
jgi:hypothetical protein